MSLRGAVLGSAAKSSCGAGTQASTWGKPISRASHGWRCYFRLDARTPHAAVAAFQSDLCLALSCLTQIVPQVEWYGQADVLTATLAGDATVPVTSTAALRFGMTLQYRVVQDSSSRAWAIRMAAYEYTVTDSADHELLVYHWHPEWKGEIAFAHLHPEWHLLAAAYKGVFSHRHLPTGGIALEEVVWMLIEELGVQPRREDWRSKLTETRDRSAQRQPSTGHHTSTIVT